MSIDIYNEIGEGGFSPRLMSAIMKDVKPDDELEIRINSAGGSVFDGLAIYNMLAQHKGKKTVKVMGWAASMASVIAMAGDEILMGDGAFMMIHNPWTLSMGDSEQLRKDADLLDSIKSQLIGAYSKKSKMEASEIAALMDAETWLTADEAVEKGFASGVFEGMKAAASVRSDVVGMTKIPEAAKAWLEIKENINGNAEPASVAPAVESNPAESEPATVQAEVIEAQKPEMIDKADMAQAIQSQADLFALEKANMLVMHGETLVVKEKEIKDAQAKIATLDEALKKKQSLCDKLAADIKELGGKLEKLVSSGLQFEVEVDTWQSALSKCDGDYVKARKQFPAVFSRYMSKMTK